MQIEMKETLSDTKEAGNPNIPSSLDRNNYNILYVDDEVNNLNSFRAALRRYYNVFTARRTTSMLWLPINACPI